MSPCEKLIDLPHAIWGGTTSIGAVARARAGIEAGQVLFLPELSFARQPREAVLFTPAILGSAKNASFDPATGRLGGTNASGDHAELLRAQMRRFSDAAAALVNTVLPDYRATIARGRASFRPAEIAGRASSWRKDDTRLHVDSFPATPTGGRRILRVFTNVNPDGNRVRGGWVATSNRWRDVLRTRCRFRCPAAATCWRCSG